VNRFRTLLRAEKLEDRAVPATFYVAPTGSNANVGTSAAAPWLTLQYAAGKVAAGDTVVVAAGNYTGFNLTTSGTAAARITFSAQPGAAITARNPVTPDGINLEGASYVTVEGFTVNGMPRTGIRSVTNDFVIIRNNSMDQNGRWGILTGFSDDLLIENNVCSRSVAEHGIYVGNSGDRPVIRGNTCWGNNANGIHMNGDLSAGDGGGTTDGDGVISGAVVENNTLYDNGAAGGSGINCDGVQNSTIRNNLIYNTRASGISLYQIDGGQPSTGNRVVNNTVLVSNAGATGSGRWALNISDASTGNTVRNNVFYSYHSFRGAITISADSLGGFTSDYNAVEDRFSADGGGSGISLAAWRAATGQDTHSFAVADPTALFVNAAAGDYHLKAGSPAIDRGTADHAPGYDFEADVRPQGSGYDIGYDEFPVPLPGSPPPPLPRTPGGGASLFAVAAGPGGGPHVRVYHADGSERFSFFAYDAGFTGGISVATADVTGDGVDDIITGALSGGGPHVQIFDGTDLRLVRSFFAYAPTFRGGVQVAAGDVTGDKIADVITSAGSGGGPHVQVFDGKTGQIVRSFFAYAPGFTGGVRASAGDVTGDGIADIATAAGSGGGPHVKVFDGITLTEVRSLFAFDTSFGGGLNVAAGDVTGDGVADLIAGQAGRGSAVRVIDGRSLGVVSEFDPFGGFGGGSRVTAADVTGDNKPDVVVGAGPGGGPRYQGWSAGGVKLFDRFAYDAGFDRGIAVG
jgi:parallel beta-helix repeat protein